MGLIYGCCGEDWIIGFIDRYMYRIRVDLWYYIIQIGIIGFDAGKGGIMEN